MKNFQHVTATEAVKHDVFSLALTFLYILKIFDKNDYLDKKFCNTSEKFKKKEGDMIKKFSDNKQMFLLVKSMLNEKAKDRPDFLEIQNKLFY